MATDRERAEELVERIVWCAGLVHPDSDARRAAVRLAERALAPTDAERCSHGWRGSVPENGGSIADPCPACRHTSLFIGTGGWLTCGNLKCPDPRALHVLLRSGSPNASTTDQEREAMREVVEAVRVMDKAEGFVDQSDAYRGAIRALARLDAATGGRGDG